MRSLAPAKRTATHDWLRSWVPQEFHGALQGRDALSGLAVLDHEVNCQSKALAALELRHAGLTRCSNDCGENAVADHHAMPVRGR